MNEVTAAELIRSLKGDKPIAEGSSRKVYSVNDYIIKKAKNARGRIECRNESWLYTHIPIQYKQFLCPILYSNENYIIMEKAKMVSIDFFEDSIKKDVGAVIEYLWNAYQMDDFDLKCNFNWGWLNNLPVLIDYGHNYYNELCEDDEK